MTMKNRKEAIINQHQVLIKRRDALRRALAGDLSLLKELRAQTSGDVVDAALDSVQDEISSQLAEVESRELARIENALERMRDGQYGICEGCSCSIPIARLNALPYATLCIKCQREAEREGAGGRADVDWSRLLDSSGGEADLSINDIELDVS
jgi:DnaK suppressor protein